MLLDVAKLVTAYYALVPDPTVPAERIAFGTSGHRGSAFDRSFNEAHVLAISQAIVQYRRQARIDGPLFLGVDTHALSQPACATARGGARGAWRRHHARRRTMSTRRRRSSRTPYSATTAAVRQGWPTAS